VISIATAKPSKTHIEKVEAKVGKRPKTASDIGTSLGFKSHHGVSKALGQLVRDGKVQRTEKGYQKV